MATGVDASGEEALMARMASGDNGDPMVALYELYGGRVFGLGVRLLGDRGQAEEMVQETFVRLWRSARRFDPEKGSVRTFTFTIARRVAIDLRRRSAARPNEVAEPAQERSAEVGDAEFERLILGLDVRDALRSIYPSTASCSNCTSTRT